MQTNLNDTPEKNNSQNLSYIVTFTNELVKPGDRYMSVYSAAEIKKSIPNIYTVDNSMAEDCFKVIVQELPAEIKEIGDVS